MWRMHVAINRAEEEQAQCVRGAAAVRETYVALLKPTYSFPAIFFRKFMI